MFSDELSISLCPCPVLDTGEYIEGSVMIPASGTSSPGQEIIVIKYDHGYSGVI